jgi:hypothetical protein
MKRSISTLFSQNKVVLRGKESKSDMLLEVKINIHNEK